MVRDDGRHDVLYAVDRKEWATRWDQLAGFARIDLIEDGAKAVHGYVSKYVAKGGQINLSRNVEFRRPFRGGFSVA